MAYYAPLNNNRKKDRTKLSPTLAISWTVACQAPLSMRFPRQEYWSGLPFPSPGDLLDPGFKQQSPALAGGFSTTEPPRKPHIFCYLQTTCSFLTFKANEAM